ncbi:hypothetical protein BJ742DRAFT_194134 [Cladochytrium replicatum]|nr:hypothetical protein BJ742DRAFT_194134 [Cladochytrium replicatum]
MLTATSPQTSLDVSFPSRTKRPDRFTAVTTQTMQTAHSVTTSATPMQSHFQFQSPFGSPFEAIINDDPIHTPLVQSSPAPGNPAIDSTSSGTRTPRTTFTFAVPSAPASNPSSNSTSYHHNNANPQSAEGTLLRLVFKHSGYEPTPPSMIPVPVRHSEPAPSRHFRKKEGTSHQWGFRNSKSDSVSSNMDDFDSSSSFLTPQNKLVRPVPAAFHSTGLISKKNRPKNNQPTPETPLKKKDPLIGYGTDTPEIGVFLSPTSSRTSNSVFSVESEFPPTPSKGLQLANPRKHRKSLNESPVKFNKKMNLGFGAVMPQTALQAPSTMERANFSPADSFSLMSVSSTSTPAIRRTRAFSSPQTSVHDVLASASASVTNSLSMMNNEDDSPPQSEKNVFRRLSFQELLKDAKENNSCLRQKFDRLELKNQPKAEPMAVDVGELPKSTCGAVFPYAGLITRYVRFLTPEYCSVVSDAGSFAVGSSIEMKGGFSDYLEENFFLLAELGRGSFATAYKVQSKNDGMTYAVKKTRASYTGSKDR